MKKIILLFTLLFTTISQAWAGDVVYSLSKCLRYGTNVVLVFNVDNQQGRDIQIKLFGNFNNALMGIYVFDAEGNRYATSDFTYGTVTERALSYEDSYQKAPLGKEDYYNYLEIPDGVKLQVRVGVRNVPPSLKAFQVVQLRGYNQTPFCFNFTAADGDDLNIETVR